MRALPSNSHQGDHPLGTRYCNTIYMVLRRGVKGYEHRQEQGGGTAVFLNGRCLINSPCRVWDSVPKKGAIKIIVNVIIHGCGGKMGHVVAELVKNEPDCQVVAGIDPTTPALDFPVFPSCEACDVAGDVIIDFSTAKAVPALLAFSKAKKIPVVLCTTALSEETTALMQETSKEVAILKSANMSVGVNLLLDLVQRAAVILAESGFDIEIVEKHHNQKIDAPSGTAMALADAINQAMEERYHYVYDRSQVREKREKTEIGIHAVRGGNIVGEHDVIFAGRDEVIELTHRATSREVFAVGAVKAAKFLAGKPAGLYTMKEVLQ